MNYLYKKGNCSLILLNVHDGSNKFLNCINETSSCFKDNGALTLRFGNLLTGSNVGNYLLGVGYPSMEAIEKTYDELLAHSSYKELMTFAKVNMRNIIKIL